MRYLFLLLIFCAFTVQTPVQHELNHVKLKTEGEIPTWLMGTLVRNGPVDVTVNGKTNSHWFDGLAMLHAFSFKEGHVSYSNKFLRTNAYKTVFKEGSLNYGGFSSEVAPSRFKKVFTWFFPSKQPYLPNANVNVIHLANQYAALTETPLPVRFDLETLNTLGVLNYDDDLPHSEAWECVHMHREKEGVVNYLIEYGQTSNYVIYRIIDGMAVREPFAKVPVSKPAYMHSFAMTENFVILTEFPLVVNPIDLLTSGKPFIQNFTWEPDLGTIFNVVEKSSGRLIGKYKTKPFFAFHHVNAYEKEKSLIIDIVTYNDARVIQAVGDHFREEEPNSDPKEKHLPSFLERFVLSLEDGNIESQKLGTHNLVEFPRFNEKYDGLPYQFAYLADAREVDQLDDIRPLFKVDMDSQKEWTWSQAGCYPGEPVFVASPHSKSEDDGLVLSVILDRVHKTSFLLILDAKNFKEIGRAYAPQIVPPGLHGQYFQ